MFIYIFHAYFYLNLEFNLEKQENVRIEPIIMCSVKLKMYKALPKQDKFDKILKKNPIKVNEI